MALALVLSVATALPFVSCMVVPPILHNRSTFGNSLAHVGSAPSTSASSSHHQDNRTETHIAIVGSIAESSVAEIKPGTVSATDNRRQRTANISKVVGSARMSHDNTSFAALLELKGATVMHGTQTAEAKLEAEVQALAQRRAKLKSKMEAQVQEQVRSQLEAEAQAEMRHEVRRQVQTHLQAAEVQIHQQVEAEVQAQMKTKKAEMEKQARAKVAVAEQRLQTRVDSAANAVVTFETRIEETAVRVNDAVTWAEKVQREYPNTQAFFLGTFLLSMIGCGFTICWGDVERLAMKKERSNF